MLSLQEKSLVDTNNIHDISGFASLLCKTGSESGMSTALLSQTKEPNELRQLAIRFVRRLKEELPSMSAADAFAVLPSFDSAHRIAYMRPASQTYLNGFILRAFDAMIHGDKSVDEYAMFREIQRAIARRDSSYFDKPLKWLCLSEERWYNEASLGYDHTTLSPYDIINRSSILLESDLFAYEGRNQMEFKRQLAENTRCYIDTYDDSDRRMRLAVERYRRATSGIAANVVAL